MGSVGSSDRIVTNYNADPESFPAGLAVKDNAGALSLSTGSLVGVSLGKSLSDHKKLSVVRAGNRVPLQVTDEGVFALLEVQDITYTAKAKGVAGNSITIAYADTAEAGSETVDVTGTDIVVGIESGVSTATQVKAAIDASPEALALIGAAITGTAGTAQVTAAEAPLADGADSYPYVVIGAAVKIDASSGKASSDGVTSGAVYCDGVKTGQKLDGTTVVVAVIDMGGGL